MAEKRLIDANELEEKAIYITGPKGSACHAVPLGLIQAAPTIDPENLRPVAHWDMEEDAVGDPIIWTCSNCKESIVMYDGAPMENGYKYCPHCGARLEDGTEEES
jgi:hypothetical protein